MIIKFSKNSNCLVIAKTCGKLSFLSFQTIQFLINQNKKFYKRVYFKKIPPYKQCILIQSTDIILEFVIENNIIDLLKVIKSIAYKVSFKFKMLYLKK